MLPGVEEKIYDNFFVKMCVLKVGESTFHCHKFMLARKSDVFDAMFSHEFSEKHDNKVVIEDLEAEAVLEMLRFIYQGKVQQMERVNKSVLFAADKYNIVELKGIYNRLSQFIHLKSYIPISYYCGYPT